MLHLDDPTARPRAAYQLWLDTYRRTRNPRHLHIARVCLAIANEAGGKPPTRAALAAIRAHVLTVTRPRPERPPPTDAANSAPPAHARASTPDRPS